MLLVIHDIDGYHIIDDYYIDGHDIIDDLILHSSCPRVGWTHGSSRVTILPEFSGSGRVSTSDYSVVY